MSENYFYQDPAGSHIQSPVPSLDAIPDVNDLLQNLNARLQSLEARNQLEMYLIILIMEITLIILDIKITYRTVQHILLLLPWK